MTAIRIIAVAGSEFVTVIDETTGMAEQVEMTVAEEAVVDTIVEDEPDVSGRYLYTP